MVLLEPGKTSRHGARGLLLVLAFASAAAPTPAATRGDGDGSPPAAAAARHWAYVPPVRPAMPDGTARHPIDRFVERGLARAGLSPLPAADRVTLARRLSLDLTGLPPEPALVDAFVADESPAAEDELVQRLLGSTAHAEHLAAWWLDLARYADTNGYEVDRRRTIWPWRDWVIAAFERDLPFDRFTIEQLAGDLLPDADLEQRIATGFHRNTMVNQEGGVDAEEFRVAAVVDRVNTTARVWMGTTLECAQCHDHEFDPFSQREYFGLYAFFDNTQDDGGSLDPVLEAPDPAQRARLPALRAERDELTVRLSEQTPELDAELLAREERMRSLSSGWEVARPRRTRAEGTSRLAVLDDDSVLALGEVPESDTYVVEVPLRGQRLSALRLDVIPDASLSGPGPGRTAHGNFVLSELELSLVRGTAEPVPLALESARADHEQPDYAAALAIDRDGATGWAVGGDLGRPHRFVVSLAEPFASSEDDRLVVRLVQEYGYQHVIGRFQLATFAERPWVDDLPLRPDIEALLRRGEARTEEQQLALEAWHRERSPRLAAARERLQALEQALEAPTTPVMAERDEPRETRLHRRGDFLDPGDVVAPGVPAVLGPLVPRAREDLRPPDRLDLARWLVSRDHPLTARVIVNRLWERLFGTGLVATVDDFGSQGSAPTHVELLDWLAVELVARDWRLDELLAYIVSSETYRRASRLTPEHAEDDPANRWLARAPRYRLAAETLRDVALAASGLLSPDVGGPSVFPPQPGGTWAMTYSADAWEASTGSDRHRRGLYTFWRRTAPYPTYLLFDAPSREVSCTRRPRTNTPLQALALLNDPMFFELAGGLARRMHALGGGVAADVAEAGFRLCVARHPERAELAALLELYAAQRDVFAAEPERARRLLAAARLTLDEEVDEAAELAAWLVVANTLLNLDETVTRS